MELKFDEEGNVLPGTGEEIERGSVGIMKKLKMANQRAEERKETEKVQKRHMYACTLC